ncbi:Hypothetical protein A7982_01832 [Minicystis rosea]|nr:Hypothetical protein A7982_01832 [Minicystis rosea]
METISTVGNEGALDVLAALIEEEARVARAEAVLAEARRRLSVLQERYRQLVPPLSALVLPPPALPAKRGPRPRAVESGGTMRTRILRAMEARPDEVLTAAMLAPAVAARSRDAVRNALLVLAAKGKIEKVGLGQYRIATTRRVSDEAHP